jgi:hypothetical protein
MIIIKIIKFYFWTILLFFAFWSPAYAYLDPGTISIVLQAILAAIAGVAATYRLWLFKFKSFLSKIIKRLKTKNNNFKDK